MIRRYLVQIVDQYATTSQQQQRSTCIHPSRQRIPDSELFTDVVSYMEPWFEYGTRTAGIDT